MIGCPPARVTIPTENVSATKIAFVSHHVLNSTVNDISVLDDSSLSSLANISINSHPHVNSILLGK